MWYENIDNVLRDMHINRSNFDINMYYVNKNCDIILFILRIDDLFII